MLFRFRRLLDLFALLRQLHGCELARIRDGEPLAERHRARAGHEPGSTGQQDRASRRACAGDPHHQAEVRYEPVVRAEHGGAQVVARGAAMPRLRAADLAAHCAPAALRSCNRLDDCRVPALFRRNRQRIGLTQIFAAIVELRGGHCRQHEARTEAARERADQARAQRRRERNICNACSSELVAPEARMPRLGFGQLQEDVAPARIALGSSERVVERRAVQLVDEVGAKALDVVRGLHPVIDRVS